MKPDASHGVCGRRPRWNMISRCFGIALVASCALTRVQADTDLTKVYRGTLEQERRPRGHDWVTAKGDSWKLNRFELHVPRQLSIRVGASLLVIGRSGVNAVWAAVLPASPGDIVEAPAGAGEHVSSVWLRFHPSQVGELFPKATVDGPGPLHALIDARRLYLHKITGSHHVDGMPAIPPRGVVVADIETSEGNRRFLTIDTKKRSVAADPALLRKVVPKLPEAELEANEGVKAFDTVWGAFDSEYPMFSLKRGVDWPALGDAYRPLAVDAKGPYDIAGAIALLLGELRDLNVSVKIGNEEVWCFDHARFLNANWNGTQAVIGTIADGDRPVRWGKTRDTFGYIAVMNLLTPAIAVDFDRALSELKGAKGLIVDLRFNGGGSEEIARKLGARFHSKAGTYGSHRFRSGPRHHELGDREERRLEPLGAWTFEKPLAVLIGERTMGAAEAFASMLAIAPGARFFGDRTAGSGVSILREIQLPHKITVTLPRCVVHDHTGEPVEGRGLQPHERIEARPEQYTSTDDPVVRTAMRWLRRS